MSFRSRPAVNRPRMWEDRDRRSILLNVGFAATVVAALLLLVAAFAISWFGDAFASAASVNGQSISKDAYERQLKVNTFRLSYQEARVRTLLTAGQLRTSDAETRLAILSQRRQQIAAISLEQLIDGTIMEQLAQREGVAVTDADVDAAITEEATTPELRHAWMIAVEPTLAEDETEPTAEAKAAAKAAADKALADLKGGKTWDEVAKAVSTDATRDQAGDLGFIDENTALDQAFTDALMAAAVDTPTSVIEGEDGTYRIGRVSEIVAPVVDSGLQDKVRADGIDVADFRAAIRRETVRSKLNDAVIARASAEGPQRHVAEIYLAVDDQGQGAESEADAVKIRHILFSPNDDAQAAGDLAATDPAWAAAEAEARAAYDKVKADISQFDTLARTDNDDAGSISTGGRYWFTPDASLDEAFAAAIFAEGLQPGQLLAPVKSSFGWHVIQILHFGPDTDWAARLRTDAIGGTDFATLARDNSDGAGAAEGGDIGWVAKGQLDRALEAAVFATPVGTVSEPVTVEGDGTYLFKVIAEEVRKPDDEQLAVIKSSAFSNWYAAEKAAYTITRDSTLISGG